MLLEADEVKVKAQPFTNRKELWVYTGMILTAARRYYFVAESAAALWWQMGSLLVVLGVHGGQRQWLVLADGAKWIRRWFEGLQVAGKAMIVCWYHLVKRCEHLLSLACQGRFHRAEVQKEILGFGQK